METCDACGPAVSAKVIVSLPSGRVLTYCYHHGNAYKVALDAQGALMLSLDDTTVTSSA